MSIGPRSTFGRVDAVVALVKLLTDSTFIMGVQVDDAYLGQNAPNECIWCGEITGTIAQGPMMSSRPTIDDDEFVIPIHILAGAAASQQASIDARRRCEELMTGVRQTIATKKTLNEVDGLFFVVNAGADGPDPDPTDEGWVAYGTVNVAAKIRMQ